MMFSWPDLKSDQMQTWPAVSCGGWGYIWLKGSLLTVVPNLAMRCLYQGDGTSGLCDQGHHTHGHQMSAWGEGKVDIFFDRVSQLASLPAAVGQPASHVTKYQPVRLWVGQMVAGGQGAWPHWTPVQDPSTPTGSLWGVTYLTKARQVTQMSSAAYYIPLALLSGTVCSFLSTSPNHIFLHKM